MDLVGGHCHNPVRGCWLGFEGLDVGVREREEGSMTPKKILECLPELMACFLELPGIEVPRAAEPCWLSSSLCADSSMGRKWGASGYLGCALSCGGP